MYRDELTEAEARARELERRVEGACQDNTRLRELLGSRPSPWSRAAMVSMPVVVFIALLGVFYEREMSRGTATRALGPKITGAPGADHLGLQ
jgi:hypothetical protein